MSPVASRLLNLSADRRAPAAARAAVREVLATAHLNELLDDALLLATELTTNAVLHVGAEISVLVEASDESVTVTIRDSEPDELPQMDASAARGYPLAITGRGLLLVDKIAYRWGTTQDVGGKAVWFQLAKDSAFQPDAASGEAWRGGAAAAGFAAAGFVAWFRRRLPGQTQDATAKD